MEFNTTDQDEIEQIKKWWKENGSSLLTGIVVGLGLLFGWQGWNQYKDGQGVGASQYFEQMQNALVQQDKKKAGEIGEQLLQQYDGTIYAANGALAMAAIKMEQGDSAGARFHFQWVLENSSFDHPRQLARLGMARSYLSQGEVEQALKQLEIEQKGLFGSHFSEVRGDALRKQGNHSEAQVAYVEALQLADAVDPRRDLLEMKLTEVTP